MRGLRRSSHRNWSISAVPRLSDLSSYQKNVLLAVGGTGAGQLLALLAVPVLTRIYPPEAFGVFALFFSSLAIVLTFCTGRYEVAIPLGHSHAEGLRLMMLAATGLSVSSVIVLVGFATIGAPLLAGLGLDALVSHRWLFSVAMMSMGMAEILTYWAIRARRFGFIFVSRVSQSGFQAATQIVAGLAGIGAGGLILGDVVGRGAGALVFAPLAVKGLRTEKDIASFDSLLETAKRFRRFPLFFSGATFINLANSHLIPILVVVLFGVAVGGHFSLAQRVVLLPTALIGQGVGQVFFTEAASLHKDNQSDALRTLFGRTIGRLFALSLPIGLLLVFLGPKLFVLTFGGEWRLAGSFVRTLAILMIVQFVYSPVSQLFNVFDRQRTHLAWSCLLAGGSSLSLIIGWVTESAGLGVGIFAAWNAAVYLGAVVLFWRWLSPGGTVA